MNKTDKYFKDLLPDRENPYQINLELKIKKLLSPELNYKFEIQKNNNPKGTDFIVYVYEGIKEKKWTKKIIAYVEIEVSEEWKDEKYPNHWKVHSFLARKVRIFDFKNNEFLEELKENSDKTIYMIWNKSLNDCITCNMETINDFKFIYKETTGNYRNDCYLRTNKQDERVRWGIDECNCYISNFIQNISNQKPKNTIPKQNLKSIRPKPIFEL